MIRLLQVLALAVAVCAPTLAFAAASASAADDCCCPLCCPGK
jgi:hypothetical protein